MRPAAPPQAWARLLEESRCTLQQLTEKEDYWLFLFNFFIVEGVAYSTSDLYDGQALITRYSNM